MDNISSTDDNLSSDDDDGASLGDGIALNDDAGAAGAGEGSRLVGSTLGGMGEQRIYQYYRI